MVTVIKGRTIFKEARFPAPDGSLLKQTVGTLPVAVATTRMEGFVLPLIKARIWLAGHSFGIGSAIDYGGAKIADLQNKNLLIAGFVMNVKGTLSSPVVGTDLTLSLGTAVAAATPLATTAIDYMAAKTGVGITQEFTVIGHSFDNSTPAWVFLDGQATANDVYLNGAATVAANCTVAFTGGYVDMYYVDMDEPVALA